MRLRLLLVALLGGVVGCGKPLPPPSPGGPRPPPVCEARYRACVIGCSLQDPLSYAFCVWNCASFLQCGEGF